ncbi:MAG: FAD-dependent oxidoreductase [Candidatus Sulfotelmatobacter sp.]
MTKQVCIIGGGVAGMQVALALGSLGVPSLLVEKSSSLGGRVPMLSKTFPFFNDDGFNDGKEFTDTLERDLRKTPLADIHLNTEVTALRGDFPDFTVELSDGSSVAAGAVVVATGFTPFDPTSLKEYGYGVYPNVITATELEWMLNPRGPTSGRLVRRSDAKTAERLAIVFCVGSRNRRIGAPFCSRICCSYSTKQASTVMERNPKALVACFYMDVRTYDRGFEEMYSLAQERGVRYIRGRVSMCRQLPDGSISVRAENTLLNRPFSGEFDLVSLSTGMRPCADVNELARCLGISCGPDGFFLCREWFRHPHDATRDGIFLSGCATGMKPIRNCMIDGAAVAARVTALLREADA